MDWRREVRSRCSPITRIVVDAQRVTARTASWGSCGVVKTVGAFCAQTLTPSCKNRIRAHRRGFLQIESQARRAVRSRKRALPRPASNGRHQHDRTSRSIRIYHRSRAESRAFKRYEHISTRITHEGETRSSRQVESAPPRDHWRIVSKQRNTPPMTSRRCRS